MDLKKSYFLQIHIAVLLFGGAGLFGKLINISAGGIVLGRAALASLFILLVQKIYGNKITLKRSKDSLIFLMMGAVLAFHWTAFFQSIQLSTVAIGVVTFSTFPVFTSMLEPIVFHRKFRKLDFLLAIIALTGVGLIVPSFDMKHHYTIGALWGLASGASFAVLTLGSKKMMQNYSSNAISLFQNSIAALLLSVFFYQDIFAGSRQDWIYLLILGILFTGIAHTLFINSMQGMQAYTASLIACLEPFYGIILAWLILNESPNSRMLIGGIMILGVASYASLAERK